MRSAAWLSLSPSPRSQLTDVFSIYIQELWLESKITQLPEQRHGDTQGYPGIPGDTQGYPGIPRPWDRGVMWRVAGQGEAEEDVTVPSAA